MKYRIKQSSPWLYIATLLSVIFIGMAIIIILSANQIIPKGPLVFILCFAPVMGLAFFLPKYTATADIEIYLDNVGLKRTWVRQFIFHNKIDEGIQWNEIKDYVFQPDRQFDQFKMHLKDGRKFKFYHNTDHDGKDDFQKFQADFSERVELYNNVDEDKKNDIRLGKTIYETGWGVLLAIFGVAIIIGLPILLLFFPIKKSANYAMLAFSYIGAFYFIIQVYVHRKRRKEYENSIK